jgi:flagellin-specific chaperone FliS
VTIDDMLERIHWSRRMAKMSPLRKANLIQNVRQLERRLNDGWDRINQAEQRGDDAEAWIDFWIELLHQYEAAWDDLSEARP